jgi:hypothetical protein
MRLRDQRVAEERALTLCLEAMRDLKAILGALSVPPMNAPRMIHANEAMIRIRASEHALKNSLTQALPSEAVGDSSEALREIDAMEEWMREGAPRDVHSRDKVRDNGHRVAAWMEHIEALLADRTSTETQRPAP